MLDLLSYNFAFYCSLQNGKSKVTYSPKQRSTLEENTKQEMQGSTVTNKGIRNDNNYINKNSMIITQ